ncbi:hypothetical protein [Candidatus Uabimicrobium amorphum]|uniref:hypothetical protein n=1 Tax=Uabimicrobium amorphum TaxID=2596890 RepID=UPI0015655F3E|nr:hypothetical protein [Candidatus Uabimicrobium amorphum]
MNLFSKALIRNIAIVVTLKMDGKFKMIVKSKSLTTIESSNSYHGWCDSSLGKYIA